MPDDRRDHLSPEGAARRNAMLAALRERVPVEAARRRRRRAATRAGVGALVIAVALGAWWWGSAAPVKPTPQRSVTVVLRPPEAPVRIAILGTMPGIAARFAVNPVVRAERIGDEELLKILESIGQPSGLVRTPERVYLTANIGEPEEEPQGESGA